VPSRIIRIILQQFARYDALLKFLDKNVLVLALAFGVERERMIVCSDLRTNMFKNIHAVLIVSGLGQSVRWQRFAYLSPQTVAKARFPGFA